MSLGQKIENARRAAGLSRWQLAVEVGVSEKAVALWENDNRHPRFEHMVSISRATGEPLDNFATERRDGEAAADTSVHR